jgi:aromatic ring-opening dioxygenase catalytic subunit (LigB family)
MEDPAGLWTAMGDFLSGLAATLAERPKTILLVSAHWEGPSFAVTSAPNPALYYDYYCFQPQTHELTYPPPAILP